jgi:hypothetical protein
VPSRRSATVLFVLALLSACGAAYFALEGELVREAPASETALPPPAPVVKDRPPPKEPKPPQPPPEPKVDPKQPAKIDPVVPLPPVVRAQWNVPGTPSRDSLDSYADLRVCEIVVDPTGTRCITASQTEAHCWDLAGHRLVHTVREGKDQEIYVSRDARFVALMNRDGKDITFHSPETGQVVAKWSAAPGTNSFTDFCPPAFTPRGDYFIILSQLGGQFFYQAVSTRDGVGKPLNLPAGVGTQPAGHAALVASADAKILMRHLGRGRTSGFDVSVVDLGSGREAALRGVTISPSSIFPKKGVKLSPDGWMVLAVGTDTLQLCDRQTYRQYLALGSETEPVRDAWFTRDGRRCVVLRSSRLVKMIGRMEVRTPDWLELYDVFGKTKVAEFTMKPYGIESISALAFTADGTAMVVADQQVTVQVIDFERAFGVPPLSPIKPPDKPEVLPLK